TPAAKPERSPSRRLTRWSGLAGSVATVWAVPITTKIPFVAWLGNGRCQHGRIFPRSILCKKELLGGQRPLPARTGKWRGGTPFTIQPELTLIFLIICAHLWPIPGNFPRA